RELIGIPETVRPVAWLCIGPVTHLEDTPDLERQGWRKRLPLGAVLHEDRWKPGAEKLVIGENLGRSIGGRIGQPASKRGDLCRNEENREHFSS
ncbi:MAG TPA: hypothetical protein VEJ87_07815, partial [Acidimicrobiales bacterium]|nr:hypothetical protein [Acidimicrobiales bacterium]